MEDHVEKFIKELVKQSKEKKVSFPEQPEPVKIDPVTVKEAAIRISQAYKKNGFNNVADVFCLIARNAEYFFNNDLSRVVKAGPELEELVFELVNESFEPNDLTGLGLKQVAEATYDKQKS